ncbi:hypothetical protein [Luteimonas panaciterrae]|uniref:hypothetical protein n=1 Tax=Luteimonas panaciterrae TaxID=363885 RepID=UPI001CF97660|nr:hypothetical protein [Luteimonas panaciterrae]
MNRSIAFVSVSLALSVLGMSQAAAQSLPPQLQMDSQRAGVASEGYQQGMTDSERYEDRASIQAEKMKEQQASMAAAYGQGGGPGYPGGADDGYDGRETYGTTVGRAAAVDLVNAAAGIANRAILTRGDNRGADLYVDQDGMIRNRERNENGSR